MVVLFIIGGRVVGLVEGVLVEGVLVEGVLVEGVLVEGVLVEGILVESALGGLIVRLRQVDNS